MAFIRSKDIPEDAVVLNEVDATTYIWDIVSNWESLSDTWSLQYSPVALGVINAFSGILINNHYRHKLKLGTYGYLSSVIPISVMPGMMTTLFHRHSVTTGMLLMKNESCPVCYEIKSAVIQCGFGIVYPMVLSSTSALMFANRYSTFRIPDLKDGPKATFQFLRKITRPFTNTLVYLGAIQLIASSVLTYYEIRNNLSLQLKIIEIEKKVLAEQGSQN